jgi:hypothetical protein
VLHYEEAGSGRTRQAPAGGSCADEVVIGVAVCIGKSCGSEEPGSVGGGLDQDHSCADAGSCFADSFFAHFRGSTGCPGGVEGATMTTRGPSKGKEDC